MIEIRDEEFSLLRAYLHDSCGIDVPPDKRYLFTTRLGDLLEELACPDFSSFHRQVLGDDQTLQRRLVEAMTTNETSFFRDGHPFEALRSSILPSLARRRGEEALYHPPLVRIWSVGCATGEEPYSIAICAHDWLSTDQAVPSPTVSILAVDISKPTLDHARTGRYDARQLEHVPPPHAQKYFRREDELYVVRDEIRAMVRFAELNLAESFEQLGRFDVIFCRNVMIYFALDLKRRILDQFFRMLNPGGVLLMGASENLYNLSDSFQLGHSGSTTYYHKEG